MVGFGQTKPRCALRPLGDRDVLLAQVCRHRPLLHVRAQHFAGEILAGELARDAVGLFLTKLGLEDAHRDRAAVAGFDPVVTDEAGNALDQGRESVLDRAGDFLHVAGDFELTNRCVHS